MARTDAHERRRPPTHEMRRRAGARTGRVRAPPRIPRRMEGAARRYTGIPARRSVTRRPLHVPDGTLTYGAVTVDSRLRVSAGFPPDFPCATTNLVVKCSTSAEHFGTRAHLVQAGNYAGATLPALRRRQSVRRWRTKAETFAPSARPPISAMTAFMTCPICWGPSAPLAAMARSTTAAISSSLNGSGRYCA